MRVAASASSGSCASTAAGAPTCARGWKGGSTRQNPHHTAAPDLLGRDFTATAPNTKWVADLTRILTGEGLLWLASVRDAFANKVVGWDSGPRATTELVVSALDYAIWSRDVRDGQLIHHSDKGCQYTSVRFTQRLVDAGIAPSTGGVGDSFDNALAENLWSTLKIELIYWPATTFATRAEAQAALFRYIDGWYNPRRIQAGLDGLSPDEYEAAWQARQRNLTRLPSNPRAPKPDSEVSGKPGELHPCGVPAAVPEASLVADENLSGAELVTVHATCQQVGDPLPGRGLYKLAQHDYEANRADSHRA